MSRYQDYHRRRSFSYKMKCWLWSDHTEEIKTVFKLIGKFIIAVLWFGLIFFIPHFFH